jgi:hypothetical protein
MRIARLVDELVDELAGFEPGEFDGSQCARLVERFGRAEKALAAARVRAAVRAAEAGAHREQGFGDAAEWMARAAGMTGRAARVELDTSRALKGCPGTREALVAGRVSLAQAAEIVRTVAEVPDSEVEMLELAQAGGLSRLRDAGRDRRVRAVPAEELYARQRAVREVAHWRDELGMVCGRFRLTPEVGVPFVNRLERETGRRRREAIRAGVREPWAAHAADAFAAIVDASGDAPDAGRSRARAVDLVIVCDLHAWRRGHTHPGEPCHLLGGGLIPVGLARELAEDAFLKTVLHDGVNIHTVAHHGRHIPAELRTALELGPLPALDGVTCSDEGCERRYDLEWDHLDPVAHGGMTSYENLKPRCKPDHWHKTERDRAAGLLEPRAERARAPDPPPPRG